MIRVYVTILSQGRQPATTAQVDMSGTFDEQTTWFNALRITKKL